MLKSTNVLTPGLVLHGVVFTLWIVLLALQAALISLRRVRLHRRLGMIGVALWRIVFVTASAREASASRDGLAKDTEHVQS